MATFFSTTIREWAQKTTTGFGELRLLFSDREEDNVAGGLIYKLKRWPHLPDFMRTADVLRTLSVMSSRPVNRNWILMQSQLKAEQVDTLLQRLVDQGAVEVIDGSRFEAAPSGG